MSNQPRPILAAVVASVVLLFSLPALQAQIGPTPLAAQFESLHFRSPGIPPDSGRISDIAAFEANPALFFVGTAHGGLWKTGNAGATFTPLFQNQGLMSIGAVAMSQHNPDIVWLGTGEGTDRQSLSWGDGVWKSTDGGKTWKNMGLAHSYQISRVVIDPDDDNIVFVAAQGALFGPGGDRGLFRTTDGGQTWKKMFTTDDDTGANDVVMTSDHLVLYASSFERRRTQCCVNGGGPGSGIWKTTDGGETWKRLTGGGLPSGPLGRIALAAYARSQNIVYAEIAGPDGAAGARGGAAAPAAGGNGIYRSEDGGATWEKFTDPDTRPIYFSQVRVDPNNPENVLVAGTSLSLSTDGGRSFVSIDGAVHPDKHAIWWDPHNSNHLMIGTDGGAYTSWDMGRSWIWYPNLPVGLFYHVGFDNEWPYNVCGGMQDNDNWCGPSAVRTTAGISSDNWKDQVFNNDGFVMIMDPKDGHTVYTEYQDGAASRNDRVTGESKSIRPTPQNVVNAHPGEPGCDAPASEPAADAGGRGGRGAAETCAPYRFNWDTPMTFSPITPGVLYITANHVFRSTNGGDSWTAISPDLTARADRDQIVTMGLKGADITIGKNDGITAWPTIVSFAESPKQPGLYYAGTDDGTVSVSRDGGKTWDTSLAQRMPGFVAGAWVSKVMPSRYDAGTVYVTSDAHRINDYETHLWVSRDFGATFQTLNANLQGQAIKTLTEDLRNPDVIYAGAETGLFVSLDRGASWQRLMANLPTVRVDEITIQPRDNAMLLATHGREIWILDHLAPIQEYTAAVADTAGAHLFTPDPALEWKNFNDSMQTDRGHQFYLGENPPKAAVLQYFLKTPASSVDLKISDASGKNLRDVAVSGGGLKAGIENACWDFRVGPLPTPAGADIAGAGGRGGGRGRAGGYGLPQPQPGYGAENPCIGDAAGAAGGGAGGGRGGAGERSGPMVPAGNYTVTLVVDGKTIASKPLQVVMDPAISARMSPPDQQHYYDMLMDLHQMQASAEAAAAAMQPFYDQMQAVAGKAGSLPTATQSNWTMLRRQFDAVRVKFGVPAAAAPPAAGRGGGGGFGGAAAADPDDLVARMGALKVQIMAFTALPSDLLVKQYDDLRLAYPKALTELNAVYASAAALAPALQSANLSLTVPPKVVWAPAVATTSVKKHPLP